jgi:hypothetical protein
MGLNIRKNSKILHLVIALYGVETWTLPKYIRNSWEVLKYSAGEGLRR